MPRSWTPPPSRAGERRWCTTVQPLCSCCAAAVPRCAAAVQPLCLLGQLGQVGWPHRHARALVCSCRLLRCALQLPVRLALALRCTYCTSLLIFLPLLLSTRCRLDKNSDDKFAKVGGWLGGVQQRLSARGPVCTCAPLARPTAPSTVYFPILFQVNHMFLPTTPLPLRRTCWWPSSR